MNILIHIASLARSLGRRRSVSYCVLAILTIVIAGCSAGQWKDYPLKGRDSITDRACQCLVTPEGPAHCYLVGWYTVTWRGGGATSTSREWGMVGNSLQPCQPEFSPVQALRDASPAAPVLPATSSFKVAPTPPPAPVPSVSISPREQSSQREPVRPDNSNRAKWCASQDRMTSECRSALIDDDQ